MERAEIDRVMTGIFMGTRGIVDFFPLLDEDRQQILDMEQDAEDRSLMGLGKVVNSGVRRVLKYDLAYVALTNMEFDWGCHASLVLKKGEETVGEEVRDPEKIARLSNQKNVWFLHRNFVVYKDRISFPQDIMKKICHFEIPPLSGDWCLPGQENLPCQSMIFANPATPCDVFLKERYFKGRDEKGLGTILVGLEPKN